MAFGEFPDEDLVNDGWTDLAKRIRGRLTAPRSGPAGFQELLDDFETADFEKMSEIRARVDAIVTDQQTAGRLKAWYRQLCKRPCFHDEYLSAYNLPSVHLVDTDGQGVERIVPAGVVASGMEYPVDCIIYASGFEVGTEATRRFGFDMTGRDGAKLSDYWSAGMHRPMAQIRRLRGPGVRPQVTLVRAPHRP
jgi:cation diffusion facilitator CzcD-associated flavoprotein CzcO